ncbi:hypothetical protein WMF31_06715 [Sorangium sp. So ce1036]|uniref:hypothetical protein n=1 Tax=Sorangium sp. So ce1036 TaxID=3133328 RepID=UPI003F0C3F40
MIRSPERPRHLRPGPARPRRAARGRPGLCGLAALSLAAATCAPPLQNGSVVVSPGAAERLGVLCRWGQGGAAAGGLCPGDADAARRALSGAGQLDLRVRERGAPAPAAASALLDPLTPAKVGLFDAATGAAVSPPWLTLTGELQLLLPPGRIRVIASRGPEYTLAEATIDIVDGGSARLDLTLERVVDTTGYIACNLRQPAARGADAGIDAATQIESSAAEGVECAVTSEHDLASDLRRDDAALRLGTRLRMLPGVELTSRRSGAGLGSLSVFPLGGEAAASGEGALRWVDGSADEILRAVRALPGERVVQVSRPHGGGPLLHAPGAPRSAGDQGPRHEGLRHEGPSLLAQIVGDGDGADAVEVWTGREAAARDRAIEELWALLRASRPVTPTASSGPHGRLGAEAGSPRTYIAVADDDPARLDVADLVAGLRRRRDVVITNGPFVTMRLGDVRQGGVASARRGTDGGRMSLSIRVERAPWVDARELHVLVGGVASGAPIPLDGARTTPAGALLDEIAIPVVLGAGGGRRPPGPGAPTGGALGDRPPGQGAPGAIFVAEDTFVVAIVRGRRPLEPVLSGDPGELLPFAMTAPLWIDADGDGRSLGRAAAP